MKFMVQEISTSVSAKCLQRRSRKTSKHTRFLYDRCERSIYYCWSSQYTTGSNAQVVASLLQACYLAVIKPITGCAHIACSGLMITSLLQVVNRLDASWLSRLFIRILDASCFNNLHQVLKCEARRLNSTWWFKLVKFTIWMKSLTLPSVMKTYR